MRTMKSFSVAAMAKVFLKSPWLMLPLEISAGNLKGKAAIPKAYEGKHIVACGWTDPKMLAREKRCIPGRSARRLNVQNAMV